MELPKTIEEWEKVLTAFKGRGPNIIPLAALNTGSQYKQIEGLRNFMCAWRMDYNFYQVDGKVMFGPAQPEYLEYLTVMNRWYKNGLIDKDWVSRDYQLGAQHGGRGSRRLLLGTPQLRDGRLDAPGQEEQPQLRAHGRPVALCQGRQELQHGRQRVLPPSRARERRSRPRASIPARP